MANSPLNPRKNLTIYRTLTGPDDAAFCHRVTKALSEGWSLYGAPSVTFDSFKGSVICCQAITKDLSGIAYDPGLKLSEL